MPAELPEVLARVNGQAVTKVDFDRLVKNMEAGRGPIPAERRDEVLRGALDQLITYSVLKQEAATRKFAVADADVDAQVASMQKQFPTRRSSTRRSAPGTPPSNSSRPTRASTWPSTR